MGGFLNSGNCLVGLKNEFDALYDYHACYFLNFTKSIENFYFGVFHMEKHVHVWWATQTFSQQIFWKMNDWMMCKRNQK